MGGWVPDTDKQLRKVPIKLLKLLDSFLACAHSSTDAYVTVASLPYTKTEVKGAETSPLLPARPQQSSPEIGGSNSVDTPSRMEISHPSPPTSQTEF